MTGGQGRQVHFGRLTMGSMSAALFEFLVF